MLLCYVCIWWYVRRLWKCLVFIVGGSFSGGTYIEDVVIFVWNLLNYADGRFDVVVYLYIISSVRYFFFSMSDFEEVGDIKVDAEFFKVAYFFRMFILLILKGRDVVLYLLIAWRNSRCFVKSGFNFLFKVVMYIFCFVVIM